jgi:hypothetical protein
LPTKPFSGQNETSLKPGFVPMGDDQTTGFDHGRVHHQPVLPAIVQGSVIGHSNAQPYPHLSDGP